MFKLNIGFDSAQQKQFAGSFLEAIKVQPVGYLMPTNRWKHLNNNQMSSEQ